MAARSRANERGLDHPAVASNVAILLDEGQPTLDRCRAYIEGWLRPLAATSGLIRVRAERQMTEAFHVGKTRKLSGSGLAETHRSTARTATR